ncbi:MAG: hypothetical protein WA822_05510, partial [Albidovulum sp.]
MTQSAGLSVSRRLMIVLGLTAFAFPVVWLCFLLRAEYPHPGTIELPYLYAVQCTLILSCAIGAIVVSVWNARRLHKSLTRIRVGAIAGALVLFLLGPSI